MSPETVGNKPYNYKSDVWALGCILYEVASLKHPFHAQDLRALFVKIMRGVYAPIPFQYSSKLRNLIAKMLIVQPSKRPDIHEILQYPFVTKHVSQWLAHPQLSPFHQASDTYGNSPSIANLKIQMTDLGIPYAAAIQSNISPTTIATNNNAVSYVAAPTSKFKEAKVQVAQLQRMEKEKVKYQHAIDKLKKQKQKPPTPLQISPAPVAKEQAGKKGEVEKIILERKQWEQKVKQLQDQLAQELNVASNVAPIEQVKPKQTSLSNAERIKMEKAKRKQEEEQLRLQQLQAAAKDYHKQRVQAKHMQYGQYHHSPPASHVNTQAHRASPQNNFDNEEFQVHHTIKKKISFVDEEIERNDDENQQEDEAPTDEVDIVLQEYEKALQETTRQIEQLRTSLSKQLGVDQVPSAVKDLKK